MLRNSSASTDHRRGRGFLPSRQCEGMPAMPRAACREVRLGLSAAVQQVGVTACQKIPHPYPSHSRIGFPRAGMSSLRPGWSSSCSCCCLPGRKRWRRTIVTRHPTRKSPAPSFPGTIRPARRSASLVPRFLRNAGSPPPGSDRRCLTDIRSGERLIAPAMGAPRAPTRAAPECASRHSPPAVPRSVRRTRG